MLGHFIDDIVQISTIRSQISGSPDGLCLPLHKQVRTERPHYNQVYRGDRWGLHRDYVIFSYHFPNTD